jgi:hypothetical protein
MGEDVLVAIDHRCLASNFEILGELYADIAQAFDKALKNLSNAKTKDRILKMKVQRSQLFCYKIIIRFI